MRHFTFVALIPVNTYQLRLSTKSVSDWTKMWLFTRLISIFQQPLSFHTKLIVRLELKRLKNFPSDCIVWFQVQTIFFQCNL